MIVRPPSLAGAVKATSTLLLPATTPVTAGAPGTPVGVTAFESSEAVPGPASFEAVTVNVYETPLVSPVTVNGLAAPVAVKPSGIEVIV